MTILAVFSGKFCCGDSFVHQLQTATGYRLIKDDLIVKKSASLSGLAEEEIRQCFSSKTSVFNKFTHEKEFSTASLRLALANEIEIEPAIVYGFTAFLLPQSLSSLLRVCLIANLAYRVERGERATEVPAETIRMKIESLDADCAAWTHYLFSEYDPWSQNLYDVVIPTDRTKIDEAIGMIMKNIFSNKKAILLNAGIDKKDFRLAAVVELAMSKAGHDVSVKAQNGSVSLTINKQVLLRSRLESELVAIAESIPDVRSVTTHVEGDGCLEQIYRKHSAEHPSRVLLVDDEQEFVQTLSERLQLRGVGSVVAFDGKTALNLVQEDEPEVMILDLRMPGIDGMELLKRVKAIRPEIEIIILTGHGNENDREKSMDLGAFAYMQKPVDIDQLHALLKRAHEKTR